MSEPLPDNVKHFRFDRLQELKAMGELPSPKGAALAVMRLTRKDDVSIAELVRAVQTDPALVGRLIKAANAPEIGAQRPVAAVQDALILLGTPTVRYLALSFSLLTGHRSGQCANFNYRRFWSHSLACAVAAQTIAAQVRTAPPEEAFSVGLLCRIGELSLATVFPEEYSRLLGQIMSDRSISLSALEQNAFALTHTELTAAILQDWGLPRMFIDPVLAHEAPDDAAFPADSRPYRLTWTLTLARLIADICLAAEAERRGLMLKLFLVGSKLSLNSEALTTVCDRVVRDWQEWAAQLSVDANDVPPFDELSRAPAAPELSQTGMPSATGVNGNLRVLVVDDDQSIRTLLSTILLQAGYVVFEASNGRDGFDMALEIQPHILITDWMMPGMDGVELTRSLRQTKLGRAIYILILTALDTEEKLIEAFDAGADDFMSKPLKARVLGARMRAGQRVMTLQQEIERDREEIRRFAAELAVTNQRLQEAALTDVLTGLPNRRYAIERFQQEWQATNRSKRSMACMMIDVDNFKAINDTHGHDVGDVVLKQTAQAIKSGLRAQDVVCRTGGDEFIVICPETDLAAAMLCGERVRKAVAEVKLPVGGMALKCSISVGVAARGMDTPDIDALIKRADEGAYQAKQLGKNCVETVQ
ncbi:MAG: diguanylate cyclase [Gammaproteobacteria bacterium]|nr:diguanylate cyclase [Rhodocyclaceae bacterium]MBU3910492.1 diguanylate cyclase [Gammaproteobacteria bacterium]MBU3989606.1 diguanylate cyclase [Gammaproteobacteria bacterium]MBU4004973.1 diguanylate cyclase [Gammaproteobacteria bacterium]MBU4020566.1 diguanylate cyclase [Gammaproteobacteria bacterium]